MTKVNKQEIEDFFQNLDNVFKEILKYEGLYRDILMTSFLDGLSNIDNPDGKENGKRFINFIKEFTSWKFKDYVSSVQLNHLLNQKKDKYLDKSKSYIDLNKLIQTKIQEIKNGQIITLVEPSDDYDFLVSEFDDFIKEKDLYMDILRCTYPYLIWQKRNNIVHKFIPPDINFFDKKNISYNWFQNEIVLVIPSEILIEIIEEAITNVKVKFIDNDISPSKQLETLKSLSWYNY